MLKRSFGLTRTDQIASLYTIRCKDGLSASITNFGATLVSLWAPDIRGQTADIVQGFDDVSGYEASPYYMGAVIGRHAGQIRGGAFTLNGKTQRLVINDGEHTMHGGPGGFHSRMFQAVRHTEDTLVLVYFSPDGEAGFPGNLAVTVTYRIADECSLTIDFDDLCFINEQMRPEVEPGMFEVMVGTLTARFEVEF